MNGSEQSASVAVGVRYDTYDTYSVARRRQVERLAVNGSEQSASVAVGVRYDTYDTYSI